jgi:hypothetical protein
MKWKRIDEARFWEMLGILPPALQTGLGFLVGEAYTHRPCAVSGGFTAAYSAFAETGGAFYESTGPMTRAEFRAINSGHVLLNLVPESVQ